MKDDLPDIQETRPRIEIPIQQVGVENVEVPFKLESKYGGFTDLVANVSMRTSLDSSTRGISMSRLLLTLKKYLDRPLKHVLIREILEDLVINVGSKTSFLKFEFRLPITKKSLISNEEFPIYYKCRFEGQLIEIPSEGSWSANAFKFFQGVKIQYISYCPCSAELCSNLVEKGATGFPHAQRSYVDALVQVVERHYVWLEDIIETIESVIKTLPSPVVKRVDEQEIARVASENPLFVEDAIREISNTFNKREDFYDWIVKCTHEESIHTSEAIAVNWKGVKGGFDETYYI